MPLHVPESLFEYKMNEAAIDVKRSIQKIDPSIGSEDHEYQIFIEKFKDIPNNYLDKFIEWSLSPSMFGSIESIASSLEKAYQISKEKGIELDPNSEKFKTIKDYFKELENLINNVRPSLSEPDEGSGGEGESEDIKNKEVAKTVDAAEDREDYDSIIQEGDLKINIVELLNKRPTFRCDINILSSDALNIPGQGIYIWTNRSYLESGKNFFKVGQYGSSDDEYSVEPKTPDETIASYIGTTIDNPVILYAVRLNDYLDSNFNKTHRNFKNAKEIEKAVHKNIETKSKTGYRVDDRGKSTELFTGLSLEEIIKIINDVLKGVKKLANYPMREEQKAAHRKMMKNYNNNSREFLLAAKMRFGKNFTLLNTAKDLGFKNILVLTYKPHVFQSLKEDIENHVNFDKWEIGDFKREREKIKPAGKYPKVFMSSAQLAQYKKTQAEDDETLKLEASSIDDIWDNIKYLKKIPWDMIVADEYHYGTSTNNFKKILEELKKRSNPYIVYVSGTAMKDIAMGRFEDNQIFEWSYLDEQKQKTLEKNGESPSKQHVDMPTMKMHLIDIDPEIIDEVESQYDIEGGEGFTMKKLISTKGKNGPLKYPGSLERLLRQIMEGNQDMSPYHFAKNINHTLWVLPKWTAGIKAMAKLMENDMKDIFGGYKILAATGSGKDVVEDIKEVQRAIKANDKTITLTCYRFKEGVSIPKWNGVFMLDDGKSVEEYLQAIFRVQNPNPEDNKQECYVFDYNPQRGLSMVYEICENDTKGKKTNVEGTFQEFNKYATIMHSSKNSMKPVDFNQVMEAFKTQTNWREKFANVKNIDISHIDEEALQILSMIKPGKRGFKAEINDNDVTVGKDLVEKARKEGKGKKLSKDEIEEALKRITTVLSNIPEYLFNTKYDERKLDDLFEHGNPDMFKKITGVELEEFERWVDMGLINPVLMTRNILSFNEAENELMGDLSGEKLEDFTKKNFQMRAEEGKTPLPLVKEMLDKLPKDIWKDRNKKFLDPCMGVGTFLLEIKDRLMENLDSIPLEEREDYILNNMIYGSDIDESKYNMAIRLLGTNEGNKHIINKDSLTYNWNMKFDVVVGNPPFQPEIKKTPGAKEAMGSGNKIWPKFVERAFESLKPDGIIAFVTPHNWRSLGSDKGTHIKARDLIWDNNILYFSSANKYFDVGKNIQMTYWIVSKDKNLKGINIPEIYRKMKFLPEKDNPLIQEFFEEIERGNNYKRDIRDHRYNKVNAILKSKSGDRERKYPHINTLSQYHKGFLDWYPMKTEGFDDKKVMVSSVRNPDYRAVYDDGKLGCGHKCRAFSVETQEEGKKLENFLNNSKIMEILEEDGKSGFAVPIFRLDYVPKTWVERFNNGEDL